MVKMIWQEPQETTTAEIQMAKKREFGVILQLLQVHPNCSQQSIVALVKN